MDYIELKEGEIVLLETPRVIWINNNLDLNEHFDRLVLTNLRIYGRYKKKNGLFKDASIETAECWLSDIKDLGDKLYIERKWDYNYFQWILEIYTKYGSNQFVFGESSKIITSLWLKEIYKSVLGIEPPIESSDKSLPEGISKMKSGFQNIRDSVFGSINEKIERTISFESNNKKTDNIGNQNIHKQNNKDEINEISELKGKKYCSNCGTMLNSDSKFCHVCGSKVGNIKQDNIEIENDSKVETGKYQNRKQEYAGTVLKCPNCGNIVNTLDAICSACGMHLSGKKSSDSVQLFMKRLMEIENDSTVENKGILSFIGKEEREEQAKSDACRKKVTLINSFPLPNSVSEIYDFMMLAMANIDIRLSKDTWLNRLSKNAPGDAEKDERAVSNAWVNKMQQVYQKAKTLFPNDPVFTEIDNMYQQKMQELKFI